MADDDEIDVLGDFSFNSCLAQNNQGIPSCSDREDTVHPHWLLDTTEANWYDKQNKAIASRSDGPQRILTGNRLRALKNSAHHTSWTPLEKEKLVREMARYGRNVRKIAQTIKTKSEAEIQALIEAEYGIHLETPSFGLEKANDGNDDIPAVVQEEIITEYDTPDINNVISLVTTGSPTISVPKKQPFKNKPIYRAKNSLLKPDALNDMRSEASLALNPTEIIYEDEMVIGSTESVGSSELDCTNLISNKKFVKYQKSDKPTKKIGNHRRKVSRNYDKGSVRSGSKDNLKSPQNRVRKDSSLSEDSIKSPKLEIVFSSGQALPVSEGEQVIKIEKNKESEAESDVEVDIDSDGGDSAPVRLGTKSRLPSETEPSGSRRLSHGSKRVEEPIAVPLSKFEPMPRRQKRLNLDGEGGYTIMHTDAGDLYAVGSEPRRDRTPKKQHVQLIQCRVYNSERPAPYSVHLHVSALIAMDAHGHTSRGEVMGLLGGGLAAGALTFRAYRPAAAAASRTHCDMDPVSQALAAESLRAAGHTLVGWHHTHPAFPPAPSALDLRTQAALQGALERRAPLLAFVTSQAQPRGRRASQYRCFRVESTAEDPETGFQFSVKLVPDLTERTAPRLLEELRGLKPESADEFAVDMAVDVCPQAGVTYLEKCVSSVSHHLRSAGYADGDPLVRMIIDGLRDVFR